MKKRIIKCVSALLLGAVLLTSFGCNSNKNNDEEPIATQSYVVDGKEFSVIDEKAKKEWKEPLAKLLANVRVPYGGKEGIDGYKASVDSKAPVLPQNYRCGLLDVTQDGIPELLVHPFGFFGSSGTETYYAYNFYSGQKLGEISSSTNGSWCFYYDTQSNKIELYGQYWLRQGVGREDFFTKIARYSDGTMETYVNDYLQATYEILVYDEQDTLPYFMPQANPLYDDSDIGKCSEIIYYIGDEKVTFDEYYAECDKFVTNKIMLPETELILIDWDDVSEDEDDYITKGKKMVEALISTEQKFIVP